MDKFGNVIEAKESATIDKFYDLTDIRGDKMIREYSIDGQVFYDLEIMDDEEINRYKLKKRAEKLEKIMNRINETNPI